MYTQAEMLEKLRPFLLREGIVYRKNKNVLARPAVAGEVIETRTGDGLETVNAAEENDYIVRNQTGAMEEYIVPAHKFSKKYALLGPAENGWMEYQSTGRILAIELTDERLVSMGLPPEFEFIAPWEDPMTAKSGDFMGGPEQLTEVYRLARKEFFETYTAVTPTE
ncbi:MAG: hypothetical protein EP344_03485 [Bacteroidetes bacterium]|nr:MAG: hypothetical protein EP344_03485 [Bacteroidota bacterium]